MRALHNNLVDGKFIKNVFCLFFLFRDVDKVHDLMDEVAEQQEIANEIGEAISNPVSFGQDVDEVSVEL